MPHTVSVVVPVYNGARFIGQCLESILVQTHSAAEILVVDDGSTDDTSHVVGEFGGPVRLLHQSNAGVSTARNRGLREAVGTLVAFCDADDLWMPTKLQSQMESLASHPSASAAFCGVLRVDSGLRVLGPIACPNLSEVTRRDLLWHQEGRIPPHIPSALLARKGLLDAAGAWDPLMSDAADWDIALRLRRLGPFVGPCDPLIWYRVHEASMSARVRLRAADAKRLFGKLLTSAAPEELAEVRAAWGRNAVVMAASLANREGLPAAAAWLLGEFGEHPWAVGKACLSRVIAR